ncbi:MAG: hypothetical protein GX573_22540, partial [Chloroflexi bacterium]|nr:hypothetical protein [Chloroflexota bacterium]
MYAEIAVNRRVTSTFHYHIPASLSGRIAPGHLVKVSFGTGFTTGIVVALSESTPIPQTKPVLERLDPQPVVTPVQLALARWMAETTLAPLGMCLWLMLPPGLAKRGDTLYTLRDEPASELSAVQQRIVSLLQRRGPLRGRQLDHALSHTRWQSAMRGLVDRDLVDREAILEAPDIKPKTIRTADLVIAPERIPHFAPRLGRESRRANVLEVLLAAPEKRMSMSALLMAVGCTEAPVRTLAESGDVAISPKQTWVELAVSDAEIAARLADGSYDRAPAQKSVLEQLLAAGSPLPVEDLNTSTVRTLESAGTIRRWIEPATVELRLADEDAQDRIIELRGGQPYLDILHVLAEVGEPVDVREVY